MAPWCAWFGLAARRPPVPDSFVKTKALADPNYNPYCLRHAACGRMEKVEHLFWRCPRCGAEHDEREGGQDA
jgi:hypothetical protein